MPGTLPGLFGLYFLAPRANVVRVAVGSPDLTHLAVARVQVQVLLNAGRVPDLTGRSHGRRVAAGDARAALAYDLYAYHIRQYIGAYAAVLNGLNAIVFTAGVGENDALVRTRVCQHMEFFGLALDEEQNQQRHPGLRELNRPEGRVKILVIPTAEEREIARQCAGLLSSTD